MVFDRHAVHRYVKSRASTSSPGISGFGFNWLQLFARLTVAQEDDEHEDPCWTTFIAFLEDFACGTALCFKRRFPRHKMGLAVIYGKMT